MTTYDAYICEPPAPWLVNHCGDYPEGYICDRCGGDAWTWESDALAWACEDCGDYLDQGDYRISSPDEQAWDAALSRADL